MFFKSLESMEASTGSKLGKELEALWQEVIDYRDTKLKDVPFKAKCQAIQNFFAKNTAKRFMDIVFKHTGLNIVQVIFKPHFETCFCTWIGIGKGQFNQRGTAQIEGILNGQCNSMVGDWLSNNEFTVRELMVMAKSYDPSKGLIKPEYRKQIASWVKCAMGFDIALGFLSNDYLPANAGCEYLTARELTAIMLHEIGHNLTLVEHAADLYAKQSMFKALEEAFTRQADSKKALQLANETASLARMKGWVKEADALQETASRIAKDLETAGKSKNPISERKIIFSLIGSTFLLLFNVINTAMTVVFGNPTNELNRKGQKKKLGDTIINERMWTWQERKADEYAFSHGYGADQVRGLEKIMKFYNTIGRSAEDIAHQRAIEQAGSNLSILTRINLAAYANFAFQDFGFRMYPPGSARYKEILKLSIKELKNHGASAEYVNKYMRDIEEIISLIDHMSAEDKYFEECLLKYKAFYKLCSIRSFVTWLVDGRVDTELSELIEKINNLNNNLVTYYGHKFEQMAKEKKG
jgi:hypothetical protein